MRKYTIYLLVALAVLLIAWDIFVYLEPTKNDTISEVLWDLGKHPILPFLLGVIAGHIFWPLHIERD